VNVSDAIMSVPLRGVVPGLACTEKLTGPLPAPLAPAVTVIQLTLLSADHGQPVCVVTCEDPLSPLLAADFDVGEIENVQLTPACVTVNVWPATVSVPTRWEAFVLAAALYVRFPLPLPLPPAVIVSHGALLELVQAHPAGAATLVAPVPPAPAWACPVGASVNVHGAAVWFTVNVTPPIVTVPARGVAITFAVALTVTVPLPLPLLPPVTVNQLVSLLTAAHEHPVGTVTLVVPASPAASIVNVDGASDNVQGAGA
jgi:hypothetical protein